MAAQGCLRRGHEDSNGQSVLGVRTVLRGEAVGSYQPRRLVDGAGGANKDEEQMLGKEEGDGMREAGLNSRLGSPAK